MRGQAYCYRVVRDGEKRRVQFINPDTGDVVPAPFESMPEHHRSAVESELLALHDQALRDNPELAALAMKLSGDMN